MSTVELRCPEGGKLLAKSILTGDYTVTGSLIEVACRWCRDEERRSRWVQQVVHRFDVAGNVVETEVR